MRRLLPALVCASLLLAVGPHAAGAAPLKGAFVLSFGPANAKHARYKQFVQSSGRFQQVVDELNLTFDLPANIAIRFEEGDGPAYYEDDRTIVMNYDFVQNAVEVFAGSDADLRNEEVADNVLGVIEFVLYHEMGHALINVYDLPVTGKEEDSVDALATVVAVITDRQTIALAGIDLFNAWAEERGELSEEDFWDEHSLDEQRMYAIICWLYGSDPKLFKDLAKAVEMDADREDACQADWQRQYHAWSKLLENHLKPGD